MSALEKALSIQSTMIYTNQIERVPYDISETDQLLSLLTQWCMGGRCVWIDDSLIDGGWAEWSHWTECSRSCGTGVQTRRRRCNDPP